MSASDENMATKKKCKTSGNNTMEDMLLGRHTGEEELVATSPVRRDWCGIFISLLVIGLISSLILTSVILLTPTKDDSRNKGRLVSLEDIVEGTFTVPSMSPQWINGDEMAFRDDEGGISAFNAQSNATRQLVNKGTMFQYEVEEYQVSPDGKYVLLRSKSKKKLQSPETLYWIHPLKSGFTRALAVDDSLPRHQPLQHAAWMAAGSQQQRRPNVFNNSMSEGNALVLVWRGSVFFKRRALDISSFEVISGEDAVTHGATDQLYKEYILGSHAAVWSSPEGSKMAFFSTNSSQVEKLQCLQYGSNSAPQNMHVTTFRYARAGQKNPSVILRVADISHPEKPRITRVQPPDSLPAVRDYYISGVFWMSETSLSATWSSRLPADCFISICAAPDWSCRVIHQGSDTWRCPDTRSTPVFSPERDHMALVLPAHTGSEEQLSEIHVVQVDGGSSKQLGHQTAGIEIIAWNDNFIIYEAGLNEERWKRHLYQVKVESPSTLAAVKCLTCYRNDTRNTTDMEPCQSYEAGLSADGRHQTLTCSYPGVPTLHVGVEGSVRGTPVANSTSLKDQIMNVTFAQTRWIQIKLQSGYSVSVRLRLPPATRSDGTATYSLLLRLNWKHDGKEGAAIGWDVDWADYMACHRGLVTAEVTLPPPQKADDIRNGGLVARTGGMVEEVVKLLLEKLPFLSGDDVAVMGSGFGGYQALSALVTSTSFRCAIAIAPITNWRNFASGFSESILGDPVLNSKAYTRAELGRWMKELANKKLMLVHGSSDLTVGLQHTLELARYLERAGVIYRQMIYPDEDHDLSGVRLHLYRTLEQHIRQCFPLDNLNIS